MYHPHISHHLFKCQHGDVIIRIKCCSTIEPEKKNKSNSICLLVGLDCMSFGLCFNSFNRLCWFKLKVIEKAVFG